MTRNSLTVFFQSEREREYRPSRDRYSAKTKASSELDDDAIGVTESIRVSHRNADEIRTAEIYPIELRRTNTNPWADSQVKSPARRCCESSRRSAATNVRDAAAHER